ncbi:AB hydrolase superfamily protein [Abortiporus biennis]
MTSRYPRLPHLRDTVKLIPRPVIPLQIPSSPNILPNLPSKPRKSLLYPAWTLTTHLVPAAYPRTTPYVSPHKPPLFTNDREARKAAISTVADNIIGLKDKQTRGELDSTPDRSLLWNCVNRYVKRADQPREKKGLTLFFAHANGFPKELWEPTLLHLVKGSVDIAEIWVWEAVNHGDAYLVNSGKLSGIYDWIDNTRDILHFLLSYIPSSAYEANLPVHLPRQSESIARSRELLGFQGRKLVAVGHSFGGASVTRAAYMHPVLFDSLVLIDPVLRPLYPNAPPASTVVIKNVLGAIQRRDHWPSREDAKKLFLASPFFQAWDPTVLDLYLETGLTEDTVRGGVKLKMPGIQEAQVFSETQTTFEGFQLVSQVDEKVELRFIMPGRQPLESWEDSHELVCQRAANTSNIRIDSSAHLIPHEFPQIVGEEIGQFLAHRLLSAQSRQSKL